MKMLIFEQIQAYGEGLIRWIESDEVMMDDVLEGGKVYRLLAYLIENPHRDSIDSNFNGMSFEELCRFINEANPDNKLRRCSFIF